MHKKVVFLIFILAVMFLASVAANSGGGGGMLVGYQTSSYPFLEAYPVTNNSFDLIYYGGFGYGVSYDGAIAGGFGFAIMDVSGQSEIAGGFGGFISGLRLIERPINLSIVSWTGIGGISTGIYSATGDEGFMGLLQEVTLEIGFPLLRWFMPTIYTGYQIAGNLIPGVPFRDFFSYTPVLGLRIQWGSFR